MIKISEFNFLGTNFQRQINDYIKTISSSDKVFVSADKSRNIYKMDEDQTRNCSIEILQKPIERLTKTE